MRHSVVRVLALVATVLASMSISIPATAETDTGNTNPSSSKALIAPTSTTDPIQAMKRFAAKVRHREAMKFLRHRRTLAHERAVRRARAARVAAAKAQSLIVSPTLEGIATCESGGDPEAISADGLYRGKYQFSVPTWVSMGGVGDPAAAPEAEQDRRAAQLLAQQGTTPWPVCGAG